MESKGFIMSLVVVWVFLTQLLAPLSADMEEVDGLMAFKNGITRDRGVLSSWIYPASNPCVWYHISCDDNNRVTRVDLGNALLKGNLVVGLGKLKNLKKMNLYNNSLSGPIPHDLANLANLWEFRLNNNRLSGHIPTDLTRLKKLKTLHLQNNNLRGCVSIPTWDMLSKIEDVNIFDGNKKLKYCGTATKRDCDYCKCNFCPH